MFEVTPYVHKNHHDSIYNPFRDMEEMENTFFGGSNRSPFTADIKDEGDHYLMEADLPGFKKENITVSLDGDTMSIRAERHSESEDKDKKNAFIRVERSYGVFQRSFDITGIQSDAIKVSYTDGVLRIVLPKKKAEIPSSKRLEIQ